jgi:hypothetical protein
LVGSAAVVEVLAGRSVAGDQQAQRTVTRVAEQPRAADVDGLLHR